MPLVHMCSTFQAFLGKTAHQSLAIADTNPLLPPHRLSIYIISVGLPPTVCGQPADGAAKASARWLQWCSHKLLPSSLPSHSNYSNMLSYELTCDSSVYSYDVLILVRYGTANLPNGVRVSWCDQALNAHEVRKSRTSCVTSSGIGSLLQLLLMSMLFTKGQLGRTVAREFGILLEWRWMKTELWDSVRYFH